jgi:aldehyde dehydrogenase (NAD+)
MATKLAETRRDWPVQMLIGGRMVLGEGAPVEVEDPSTGEIFASFNGASIGQIGETIAAARKAADGGAWAGLSPAKRVAAVRRLIAVLDRRRAEIADVVIAETGCPLGSAVFPIQVSSALDNVQGQLDLYLTLPETEDNPRPLAQRFAWNGSVSHSLRRHVPLGVVTAISAYNFPFFLNIWKIIPALVTGNCVILRPSPLTPLSALVIGDAAIETGLPEGVLQIVAEAGAEGALLLTTDPVVDMVGFTGSTDVGRKVMAQAAPTMKRLQLELGGKSAQIFMPDRVAAAAGTATGVCLSHAGQGCSIGTRVFVPNESKAEVLAGMAQSLEGVVIGDPRDPATQMGPLINAAQVARCELYVRLATEHGAKVVAGGRRVDRPGHYFQPTVLDVPDNSNPAAQDEIFGPVVSVIGYRDLDHAVEMANDSTLGLSGYIYGGDARAALDVAMRIRSGTVNVNAGGLMSGWVSMGGHKSSGLGRERGLEGLRCYQEIQVLNFSN